MPQVVLMFVEGAAIAGGLGIVCSGDIVVVTEDSIFSLTETTLGITPAQIAPFIVQRLGLNTARKLMLTAASFTGKHALKNGLADHVVSDKLEFNKIELEIQGQVKRCAPKANAITKDLVLKASKLDKEQMIELASEAFTQCILSDEGREGINAFLKKEKPKWAK
jgi:isohexenylglutaconyl-CoA hydratase